MIKSFVQNNLVTETSIKDSRYFTNTIRGKETLVRFPMFSLVGSKSISTARRTYAPSGIW